MKNYDIKIEFKNGTTRTYTGLTANQISKARNNEKVQSVEVINSYSISKDYNSIAIKNSDY